MNQGNEEQPGFTLPDQEELAMTIKGLLDTNLINLSAPSSAKLHSPWFSPAIAQRFPAIEADQKTTVLIIGGGIAGVMTAYFIARETSNTCILVEAEKIASGATGHSAGQAVNGFEVGAENLHQRLGIRGVQEAYSLGEEGKRLLMEIIDRHYISCGACEVPTISTYRTLESLVDSFKRKSFLNSLTGLKSTFFVLEDLLPHRISPALRAQVTSISRDNIRRLLGSFGNIAGLAFHPSSILLDTVQLTQKIARIAVRSHGERLKIFEETPVSRLHRSPEGFVARVGGFKIEASNVVIATNGYLLPGSRLSVLDDIAPIRQVMLGFISESLKPLRSLGYDARPPRASRRLYFYSNTRHFAKSSFLSITGGPAGILAYRKSDMAVRVLNQDLEDLLAASRFLGIKPKSPNFAWTGLLAYAHDGLRKVGPDPKDSRLLYNTSCNGIGILLSTVGAKYIADYLAGRKSVRAFGPFIPSSL